MKLAYMKSVKKKDFANEPITLAPFSHWITPEIEERRFDTRFFIARLPEIKQGSHDGSELTDSLWINAKRSP